MRPTAVLVCLTVAALQPALAADPPEPPAASGNQAPVAAQAPVSAPTASATPATATPASATAATASNAPAATAATASNADSDVAQIERRMRAKGYTTRMEKGEKMFCRREDVLGTRLGAGLHCMNVAEARANETRQQLDEELMRKRMMSTCLISRTPNGQLAPANCGN